MIVSLNYLADTGADNHLWEPPHKRIRQLIKCAIRKYLENPQKFYCPVEVATLRAARPMLQQHPHLASGVRAHVRLNINHWVYANTRYPGARVSPIRGPGSIDLARDIASYGWEPAVREILEAGKRANLSVWSNLAFELTTNPDELREYLNAVTRSIFTYCDDVANSLNTVVDLEKSRISSLGEAQRIRTIKHLLSGTQVDEPIKVEGPLDYDIDGPHAAVAMWSETRRYDLFDPATKALARVSGGARMLVVPAGATARWIWLSVTGDIDVDTLRSELRCIRGLRMAVGTQADGLSGFRGTHVDALAAQRLMCRLSRHVQVASYRELEMISLIAGNETMARDFVIRNLGSLSTASNELRDTLRTYLRVGSNIARTAEALYAHRNTIVNRLDKIRTLLPTPLEGNVIKVGLALEISNVFGESAEAVG